MRLTQEEEHSREPLVKVEGLTVNFVTGSMVIRAISDVSFEIMPGETFGLVGETGCGKSQTALALMRLTPEAGMIEKGQILFKGRDFTRRIEKEFKLLHKGERYRVKRNRKELKRLNAEMSSIRGKNISMIFQEPMTSLNPVYTVGRQISEVLLAHGLEGLIKRKLSRADADPQVLTRVSSSLVGEIDRPQLFEILKAAHLEALEDQFWFILNRSSVGGKGRTDKIMRLAGGRKLGSSTRRFLETLLRTDGRVPFKYRALNRVPIVRRSFMDVLKEEAMLVSLELLTLVNMPDAEHVLRRYPHELSGGMRQRAMIAMAVASKPDLLIADEPTSALDVTVQRQMLELLENLKRTFNMSILFISHDMGVIAEICDRVGVMYAGKIVEVATVEDLFYNPKHPYTRGLLEAIPKYGEKSETLRTIKGSVPNLGNPPKGCRFHTRCPFAFEKCIQDPHWIVSAEGHGVLCWLYDEGGRDGQD